MKTTKDANIYKNVEMELKFEQGIKLPCSIINMLVEIVQEPKQGWNFDKSIDGASFTNDYIVSNDKYIIEYRVNLSWKMITILKIKEK